MIRAITSLGTSKGHWQLQLARSILCLCRWCFSSGWVVWGQGMVVKRFGSLRRYLGCANYCLCDLEWVNLGPQFFSPSSPGKRSQSQPSTSPPGSMKQFLWICFWEQAWAFISCMARALFVAKNKKPSPSKGRSEAISTPARTGDLAQGALLSSR